MIPCPPAPRRTAVRRSYSPACVAVLALAGFSARAAAEPGPEVTIETGAGSRLTGRLAALDARLQLVTAAGIQDLPVADVRRLELVAAPAPAASGNVVVQLVDGGRITGDGFRCAGKSADLTVGGARIELPLERILSVADAAGPGGDPAAWRAALPDRLDSDVIVVDRGGEREAVACAIVAVAADVVTIRLEGDELRVKRGRVVGLEWLRARVPAGGTRVSIPGGTLLCAAVRWTPAGLVLDDALRLPADLLREIDYASGRTVRLATLPLERVAADPYFGRLAAVEGLGAFFAPRFVTRGGAVAAGSEPRADLVMRPRSEAVWRLPEQTRRLRTSVAPGGGPQAAGGVEVVVVVDDREALRRRIDAAGAEPLRAQPPGPAAAEADAGETAIPLDIEVNAGRRLTIRVEFVTGGGVGCPVRFTDPRLER